MMENPLETILQKFEARLKEDLTTKKIGELFLKAAEMREALMEPREDGETDPEWVKPSIERFTTILVTLNYKAQRIINPDIEIGSLDEQIEQAVKELN